MNKSLPSCIPQTSGSFTDIARVDMKIIFSLTLVHFIGDLYTSFIHPLMPVFVDRFSLSLAQVGWIAGVSRFLAFIVQPSVGYLADRYRTRFFILGGPLVAMVFVSLTGSANAFWTLLLFVAVGSVGSSMFHPSVAGMISAYSGSHPAFFMSVFNVGGTLAFGIGPFLVTCYVSAFGIEALPWSMALGLAVMVYLFLIVPFPQPEGLKTMGFIGSLKEVFGGVWKSIVLIWLVMVLRAFAGQSFMTFLPVMYSSQGYSLISIGLLVSLFTVAGALSGLLAGHLSDRIGFKPVFYGAHFLSTPSLLLLLFLPGDWIYATAFTAGFFILATLPLGVAMAQKLAPKGKSMASSLMMGLAYGAGGMLTPLTGKLADLFSLPPVLAVESLIPWVSLLLIWGIPEKDGPVDTTTGLA